MVIAPSQLTNWGKAFMVSAALGRVTPEGAALPVAFHIILIDDTFPGFVSSNTNPDIENITEITGRIDPVNYTGNDIACTNVLGGWKWTKDNALDRVVAEFFANPKITAINALNNVRGYALCTVDSITTGKVFLIQRFETTYDVGAGGEQTITGAVIWGT